jgi:hypothetical protein
MKMGIKENGLQFKKTEDHSKEDPGFRLIHSFKPWKPIENLYLISAFEKTNRILMCGE